MIITLKNNWRIAHRGAFSTAHAMGLSRLNTPCWVPPNSLNSQLLSLATPCASLMSQMQGKCQKGPESYPVSHTGGRLFHHEEATHQGCFRQGKRGSDRQEVLVVVGAAGMFKKTLFLPAKDPPV